MLHIIQVLKLDNFDSLSFYFLWIGRIVRDWAMKRMFRSRSRSPGYRGKGAWRHGQDSKSNGSPCPRAQKPVPLSPTQRAHLAPGPMQKPDPLLLKAKPQPSKAKPRPSFKANLLGKSSLPDGKVRSVLAAGSPKAEVPQGGNRPFNPSRSELALAGSTILTKPECHSLNVLLTEVGRRIWLESWPDERCVSADQLYDRLAVASAAVYCRMVHLQWEMERSIGRVWMNRTCFAFWISSPRPFVCSLRGNGCWQFLQVNFPRNILCFRKHLNMTAISSGQWLLSKQSGLSRPAPAFVADSDYWLCIAVRSNFLFSHDGRIFDSHVVPCYPHDVSESWIDNCFGTLSRGKYQTWSDCA